MKEEARFPDLQILDGERTTADAAALDQFERAHGFKLPASYRQYAMQFGYGKLGSLLLIYIPMEGEDTLSIRNRVLAGVFEDGLEEDLWEFEPDGSPELVRRLEPFGISENGDTLAWDPKQPTGPHEYAIHVVGSKLLGITRAADNLYDFVARCLDDRVKSMLGAGYKPLPPTFKPIKPWVEPK
jgi:hypothetical protein